MKYPSEVKADVEAKLEQYRRSAMQEALLNNTRVEEHDELTYTILGIGGAMIGFVAPAFLNSSHPAILLFTIPLGAGLGLAIAFLWNKSANQDVSKRVDTANIACHQYEQDMAKYYQDYCRQFWQISKSEETRVRNNIQAQKKMGGGIQHPLAYLAELLTQRAKRSISNIRANTSDARLTSSMILSCSETALYFDSMRFDYRSNNIIPITAGNGEKVAGFAGAMAQEICTIDPYLRISAIREENRQIIAELRYDRPNPNYIRPVSI